MKQKPHDKKIKINKPVFQYRLKEVQGLEGQPRKKKRKRKCILENKNKKDFIRAIPGEPQPNTSQGFYRHL